MEKWVVQETEELSNVKGRLQICQDSHAYVTAKQLLSPYPAEQMVSNTSTPHREFRNDVQPVVAFA